MCALRDQRPDFVQDCRFCDRSHERKKTCCPAWGKMCRKCNELNHFEVKCKAHAVSTAAVDQEEDMGPKFLSAVTSRSVKKVTALMRINECDVRFHGWTVQPM